MRRLIDMEDDTFQALSQLETFSRNLEDGGRVESVTDDDVTMILEDGSETSVNLAPVRHLIDALNNVFAR